MQKLLTLDPSQLSSGLFSGVGKAAAPLWTEGENIAFRDMGVKKLLGVEPVAGPFSTAVNALEQAYVSGQKRIYVGTETELRVIRLVGTSFVNELLYTWPQAGGFVDLETWGNWLIATNELDPVVVWKNTGVAAALAGTTFTRAKIMFRHLAFMLAFNTSNGDTMVEWCSDDDVETWTPSGSNLAGNLTLRDLDSEIVAAVPLGSGIAVYSRALMLTMSFIGGTDVYSVRPAVAGIGAVSKRSVVAQSLFNYGLTQNGVFKTDGSSYQYIDDPAMLRWLRETVNWERATEIWGFHDELLRCVTWNFYDILGERQTISYHYDLQIFSRGRLNSSAGMERRVFETPILVDSDRKVGFWQGQDNFAGAPVEFYIETKPLDFGTRENYKLLEMVRLDGTWGPGAKLKIGALDDPEATPDWFYDEALEKKNYIPNGGREAPYFVFQFYGDDDFYLTGVEFYGNAGGLTL